MLINHKLPQILAVPAGDAGPHSVKHIDLYPGLNEVPKEVVEMMKKHPVLKHHFEEENLEVIEEAGKPVESLTKISKSKAKSLIAQTSSLELLNKWIETEDRSDVKKLLQAQIDKIEKPESEEAKADSVKG